MNIRINWRCKYESIKKILKKKNDDIKKKKKSGQNQCTTNKKNCDKLLFTYPKSEQNPNLMNKLKIQGTFT